MKTKEKNSFSVRKSRNLIKPNQLTYSVLNHTPKRVITDIPIDKDDDNRSPVQTLEERFSGVMKKSQVNTQVKDS